MNKVVITGAGGFIGRHTIDTLISKKYEVHLVTSKEIPPFSSGCIWHTVDLLNYSQVCKLFSMVQPTHLLHFAWYTVHGEYWNSSENFFWLQASLQLLRNFCENGGKRIVMAGTCAEYDWNYGVCSEKLTPKNPATYYGACKYEMQRLLNLYSDYFDISSAWGRIFFVYGPYENSQRLIPAILGHVLKGECAYCYNAEKIRDFLHVQDVADAFVTLLESDIKGEVNIASGEPLRIGDIVNKIGEITGCSSLIKFEKQTNNKTEPDILIADNRRLRDEVEWLPKWDITKGLVNAIDWWKKYYEGGL